jgi:hypothetical protein
MKNKPARQTILGMGFIDFLFNNCSFKVSYLFKLQIDTPVGRMIIFNERINEGDEKFCPTGN